MDEVVIMIRGKKHWLWRAIDANGNVLDLLVQTRQNAKAAKRFFKRLAAQFGEPRVVFTEKFRSYIKPVGTLHRRPTCKLKKLFGQFKPHRQA